MIKTETGYRNTLEIIKKLEAANKNLRKEHAGLSETKYRLLEEGSEETIKELKTEVREYEQRHLKKAS